MKKSAGRLRRGLYLAPFGELSDPRTLVELAVAAEEAGWDGVFLGSHPLAGHRGTRTMREPRPSQPINWEEERRPAWQPVAAGVEPAQGPPGRRIGFQPRGLPCGH